MSDMTPDEISFFETGELPEALVPKIEPLVPEPAAAPAVSAPEAAIPPLNPVEANGVVERMLAEERQARSALEAKLTALEAKLTAKNEPIEEVPDQNTDPLGNMMHQLSKLTAGFQELQTQRSQEQQQNAIKAQLDQFSAAVNSAKATFEKTTPDFNDAYAHIRNLRTEDLRAAGVPEKDIKQYLLQDEFQIANTAIQRGTNPAEAMYNMAKRYGYVSKTTAAPASTTTAADQTEKMAQLQAGTAADKNPGRASSEAELTLEGVKDLSNHDLNKLVQDDKMWQTIIGGTPSHELF